MKKLTLAATAVSFALAGGVAAQHGHDHDHATVGKKAPEFSLATSEGKSVKLSDYKGKYVVLEWTNPDCPFVKKHYDSGNMQGLQKQWADKGVVWLTICSSAPGNQGYYESAQIASNLKENKFAGAAYLNDSAGKVGHIYGAKTTPHLYVINPEGTLIYAGAIDDKPSTKQEDIKGATNYVQDCLTEATAGKTVATSSTTPYGCAVKYAN